RAQALVQRVKVVRVMQVQRLGDARFGEQFAAFLQQGEDGLAAGDGALVALRLALGLRVAPGAGALALAGGRVRMLAGGWGFAGRRAAVRVLAVLVLLGHEIALCEWPRRARCSLMSGAVDKVLTEPGVIPNLRGSRSPQGSRDTCPGGGIGRRTSFRY